MPSQPASDIDLEVVLRRERAAGRGIGVARIRRAARAAFAGKLPPIPVSVAFLLATDETLAAMNRAYRGMPRTTDVLSFSAKMLDTETGRLHLGDIAIALPQAARQARKARHSLEDELLLLAVHGLLHLLDYDHDTPARRAIMWREQRRILAEIQPARKVAGTSA